ncbi:hypothetical protein [Neptunomonas sp.]
MPIFNITAHDRIGTHLPKRMIWFDSAPFKTQSDLKLTLTSSAMVA